MSVSLAVIVVAWQDDPGLDDCLASLARQGEDDFEVVVADNGAGLERRLAPWAERLTLHHLDLKSNLGVSTARNRAVSLTTADLLLFLDDDAVADEDWTTVFRRTFADASVAAARGRVVGRSGSLLNRLARGYDLGDARIPAVLNTEGNCAIRRSDFDACGGFDPNMFGHEGAEISARIIEARSDPDAIIYEPGAVIAHDYVDSWPAYLKKRYRHGLMLRHMEPEVVRASASLSRSRTTPWTFTRAALGPVRATGLVAEAVGAVAGYVAA